MTRPYHGRYVQPNLKPSVPIFKGKLTAEAKRIRDMRVATRVNSFSDRFKTLDAQGLEEYGLVSRGGELYARDNRTYQIWKGKLEADGYNRWAASYKNRHGQDPTRSKRRQYEQVSRDLHGEVNRLALQELRVFYPTLPQEEKPRPKVSCKRSNGPVLVMKTESKVDERQEMLDINEAYGSEVRDYSDDSDFLRAFYKAVDEHIWEKYTRFLAECGVGVNAKRIPENAVIKRRHSAAAEDLVTLIEWTYGNDDWPQMFSRETLDQVMQRFPK